VPDKVKTAADEVRSFTIAVPEGHVVKFVQFAAEAPKQGGNNALPDKRVVKDMVHVGDIVNDLAALNHLLSRTFSAFSFPGTAA
jgi:hypothetical protein